MTKLKVVTLQGFVAIHHVVILILVSDRTQCRMGLKVKTTVLSS